MQRIPLPEPPDCQPRAVAIAVKNVAGRRSRSKLRERLTPEAWEIGGPEGHDFPNGEP